MNKSKKLTKPQRIRVYKKAKELFEKNPDALCQTISNALAELYPGYHNRFPEHPCVSFEPPEAFMVYVNYARKVHFPEFQTFYKEYATYWFSNNKQRLAALELLVQGKGKESS